MNTPRNPKRSPLLVLAIGLALLPLSLAPPVDAHAGYGGGFQGNVLQGEDYTSPLASSCDPWGSEHTQPVDDWAGVYAFLPQSGCGILFDNLHYSTSVRFASAKVQISGTDGPRSGTLHVLVDGVTVATASMSMTDATRWTVVSFESSTPVAPGPHDTIVTYTASVAWYNLDVEWLTVEAAGPLPACDDGMDNDGDGWTDYPDDPGCADAQDGTENPNPACSDGIDNDGDGLTDYPSDSGCSSLRDDAEGAPCDETVVGVAMCLTPNDPRDPILTARAFGVGEGPVHGLAGHVDLYRFALTGSISVTLPCVVLSVDGTTLNPCADAGGTYVDTLQDLYEETHEPTVESGDEVVSICRGELTLTILGIGVNSAPAFAPC